MELERIFFKDGRKFDLEGLLLATYYGSIEIISPAPKCGITDHDKMMNHECLSFGKNHGRGGKMGYSGG